MNEIRLDGTILTPETLAQAVTRGRVVSLSKAGLRRMAESRALVDKAIAERRPVYGVTTGLGAKAGEALDVEALAAFSLQTLRGRAHAVGDPLPDDVVRAAMIVRLNTFLTGHSGARPDVAKYMCAVLNAGLVPVVGDIGTIGGGDLVLNATLGLSLVGEGLMRGEDGAVGPSGEMLRNAGLDSLKLAPRDGLALANHSGFSTARAALAFVAAERRLKTLQGAAALTLEGFEANLSPLDWRVLAVKPLPGQQDAAKELRAWLEGSRLWAHGAARRLQDPMSLRNLAQVHGGLAAAMVQGRATLLVELNGSSDNPVALTRDGEMISCGNYHTTELALVMEGLSRATVYVVMAQVARIARMMDQGMTGLPAFLAQSESGSNGFAPVLKLVEDLAAEICHAATPAPIWPSINALGVEDCLTSAMTVIRALTRIGTLQCRLTAIELIIGVQAVELRGCKKTLGPPLAMLFDQVRAHVAALRSDRPLGQEIEALAKALDSGSVGVRS